MRLEVRDLAVRLGGRLALDGVSLDLAPGELVALIGANGAGKTTLLRACLGLMAPAHGRVRLGGDDPRALSASARALRAAYLPQARPLAWPIAVRDAVALGRFAHGGPLHRLGPADAAAVARALAAVRLADAADRPVETLSGGEQARAHVARALCAEAPVIVADEPAAALDPLHADLVMAALAEAARRGAGALVSLHDPALALRFADRVIALKAGRVVAVGPPGEILNAALLAETYAIDAAIGRLDGAPAIAVRGPASRNTPSTTESGEA